MGEHIADKMTSLYSTSKTLRFRLEPIGETLNFIQQNAFLDKDKRKADDYVKIKVTIDEYHKAFIRDALSSVVREYEENQDLLNEGGKSDRKKISSEDFEELFTIYNNLKKRQVRRKESYCFCACMQVPAPENSKSCLSL